VESQARQMTLTVSDYRRLSQSALIEYGTAPELAETVTEALLWCDAHGITSHGLNMLPTYLERLHAGGINGQVSPKVIKQRGAVAVIDSQGGFGQVAGEFATRLALQQAKEHAVGLASVQNTNHGGALGYYTEMISQQGCVGFMAHNANATMAPFGGAETALGTNPLSFGFPGKTYPVVIDMATSATAKGKLYELARKSDTIPEGLALDANGEPTTSVQAAIKGILLPLGGPKGYSLAVAVEMLTGVLSGGLIS
jgi:LDH2 family malate/lactate/ureidoglycolate dehydrogenase